MKIYFIGIGGIGTSALARYYFHQGHEVLGSDLFSSEITEDLQKLGIKIFIGKHRAQNLPKDVDLVVYSPAIEKNNPELKRAKNLKIKCQSYPQALGELTKTHFTIAVCGSHGKSTVAGMIGFLLTKSGFDPTVILGTKLKEFSNSNCRVGKSEYLVIEADEYKESFLNYWPQIIVLLNIDFDHPDYFRDENHYILAFKKFVKKLPEKGVLVANKDDPLVQKNFSFCSKKTIWYSLEESDSLILKKLLKIPGIFNVSNALSALKVANYLGIPKNTSFKYLAQFKGTWRRFERKKGLIDKKEFLLIQDYGHHPTQIKATLEGAREEFKKRKIYLIFQPHQYQRTFYLWEKFVNVLREISADLVIITDIFTVPGRESKKIIQKINSQKLVKEVGRENVIYLPRKKILSFLKKNLEGKEVVILMGAGDIYKLEKDLLNSKK